MTRPADIHVDDLANPVLTDLQKAGIEYISRKPVELDEGSVLSEAIEQARLEDFGADDFRARLRVWLQSADEDAGLGPIGRLAVRRNCVRYLVNRLRFEDLLKRQPEILDVEIREPVIVVGLPRSGTTHLLNLMAADTRFRSLPYWESLEPIPIPGEEPGPDGVDPRLVRCRQDYDIQAQQMPLIKAMHDMAPEHVHEEIEIQELDFSSYELEWLARVPRWRDFYFSLDMRPHYAYMKRVLQALQWMRGPDRWVLKSPQHLEQIGPLFDTFPDATLVFTHRDPVAVIQSAITMLAYGDRMRRSELDLEGLADYWIDRVEHLLRACVRDRDLVPEAQSLDVLFHEFMADDIAMVERIYDKAGLPFTAEARSQFDGFMQANPRGKHGRVVYDLAGQFGRDPAEVRKRFEFYFDRFGVRPEA